MTRKDYELIAELLNDSTGYVDEISLAFLVDNFAKALELENPRFNRDRFIVACGLTPLEVDFIINN